MSRRSALLVALGLTAIPALPAAATHFYDLRGVHDANSTSFVEVATMTLSGDPGRLDVLLPRVEHLPPGSEIGVFEQLASVFHDADPPADLEDRSEWYTRLVWFPGSLAGVSSLTITTTSTTECVTRMDGLAYDVSRRPGDYYTEYTPTIQYVAGIEEAVGYLAATQHQAIGYPPGDIGLAQRWMALIRSTLAPGSCGTGGVDDAASAWNAMQADCDGMANVFASGMRSLGIPTCVNLEYRMPGGPTLAGVAGGFPLFAGLHASAGIWSDGAGAFIPVDLSIGEFGFLCAQRVFIAYHEDLSNHKRLWLADHNVVAWAGYNLTGSQAATGSFYPTVRVRYVDNGYRDRILAHDVVIPNSPGVSGIVDPDTNAERLLLAPRFRRTLNLSVILPAPDRVTIDVFDVRGRRVSRLADVQSAGRGENFYRWTPATPARGVCFVSVRLHDCGRVLTGRSICLGD